jgi:hypothetical protein
MAAAAPTIKGRKPFRTRPIFTADAGIFRNIRQQISGNIGKFPNRRASS